MMEVKSYWQRMAIMGGVSLSSGQLNFITKERYFNQNDTVLFLEHLREVYGSKPLTIFWDNASIHLTGKVQQEA